jgi:predicted metalloendopeptidase
MKHHITNKNKNKYKKSRSKRISKSRSKRIKRIKTRKVKKLELKDNFYYYVNNNWFLNTFISKADSDKTQFTILQKKVNNELHKCITHYIFKENNYVAKQCKNLYSALTNWNDHLVENQIYLFIKQITDFRKSPLNLYPFLKWTIYNGLISPIDFGIITDIKKSRKQIAAVAENGFSFTVKEMYFKKDKDHVKTRENYVKFIQAVFNLFFGENNQYSAADVFEIELDLATKMYTITDYEDLNKTYNKYTNKEAKRLCNFDLDLFLKEFDMTNVHYINFINPEYIKHAMTLMKKENGNGWTSIKWNSYWIFKLLVSSSIYHSKLHKFFFDFFTYKLKGIDKEDPRSMIATYGISNMMNSTVSKMYIQHYKNTKEIEFAYDLVSRLIKVFKERLTKNTWLSQSTKEHALNKINKLVYAIGYKDKFPEDPDCDFLKDDAFGNNVKYVNWVFNKYKRDVNKLIINNSYWFKPEEMNVFDVNAFYSNPKNEFILPNALLQPPFLDLSKKISYNLAYVGFVIAHEIIHGFDVHGSSFNEKGEISFTEGRMGWWTKEDIDNYKILQNDVNEHYTALALKDGIKINAELTLNENIADISAMNLVENALETYLFEKNIFGKEQDEYFKDLYYNYAKQWRSIIRPQQIINRLLTDQHSLAKYRVNCVLMRSKRFNTIFNIHQKDGMFFSEKIKEIW